MLALILGRLRRLADGSLDTSLGSLLLSLLLLPRDLLSPTDLLRLVDPDTAATRDSTRGNHNYVQLPHDLKRQTTEDACLDHLLPSILPHSRASEVESRGETKTDGRCCRSTHKIEMDKWIPIRSLSSGIQTACVSAWT